MIGTFLNQTSNNFPLIDVPWTYFQVSLACQYFDGMFRNDGLFEMGLEFSRLPDSKFWIRITVMPCQRTSLPLDLGAYRKLCNGRYRPMVRSV
jgi:hypothetical protein